MHAILHTTSERHFAKLIYYPLPHRFLEFSRIIDRYNTIQSCTGPKVKPGWCITIQTTDKCSDKY